MTRFSVTHPMIQTSTAEEKVLIGKTLHAWLWLAQILMALAFGVGGYVKLTLPIEDLAANLIWPGDVPLPLTRFIGAAELMAAFGLILPSLSSFSPRRLRFLTPLAAAGVLTIMSFAMIFHFTRGEVQALPINLFFAILAAFVAWGRRKGL